MSVSSVNSTTPAATASDMSQVASVTLPQKTLGQADFLKLLVAQLSAQDPLNPVSNTDFAAQMAQFSTLQATQSMQTNLSAVQSGLAMLEAGSLLGKTVNLKTSDGQAVTGVVSSVQYQAGSSSPTVVVNGQTYSLSQVTSIAQTPAQTTTN